MKTTVPCPFTLSDGRRCGAPLVLEVEPPDRPAGILGETIVDVAGDCAHVLPAGLEIEQRACFRLGGLMEEQLYEALRQVEEQAMAQYYKEESEE